jgi:hypothetical protein
MKGTKGTNHEGFFPFSRHFLPPNILLFSDTRRVSDQVSHPYKHSGDKVIQSAVIRPNNFPNCWEAEVSKCSLRGAAEQQVESEVRYRGTNTRWRAFNDTQRKKHKEMGHISKRKEK